MARVVGVGLQKSSGEKCGGMEACNSHGANSLHSWRRWLLLQCEPGADAVQQIDMIKLRLITSTCKSCVSLGKGRRLDDDAEC